MRIHRCRSESRANTDGGSGSGGGYVQGCRGLED